MELDEFKRILNAAIENEIDAQEFYSNVAGKVEDPHLKEMFMAFVKEEQGHQKVLEKFIAGNHESFHFEKNKNYNVSETIDKPTPSIDMKPADALALAMKGEEEAMNMYLELADVFSDPEAQTVFRELAEMERGHKLKMEKAFVDIGYPEVW